MQNDMAAAFNNGWWCFKSLLVAGWLVGSLWMQNEPFFSTYLNICQVVSWIYLAAQDLLMLIVAYTINDLLVKKVQLSGQGAKSTAGIILISLTALFTAGNIVWIVFQYILFGAKTCTYNNWQMSITCICGFLMYALVLLKARHDASIFTSSLVLTYCLYLQWVALSSNPYKDGLCNPYYDGG